MISIQFPEPNFRIKKDKGRNYIFDTIRKSWLLLTPEEWVRQNIVNYLVSDLNYPSSNIALEKEIKLVDLKKRFDVLVYSSQHQPWMLIECKAPEIPLTEDVLQQVLRYNISVPVQYIVITNGSHTMAWEKSGITIASIDSLPGWKNKGSTC